MTQPAQSSGHEWIKTLHMKGRGFCSCVTDVETPIISYAEWQAHVASVAQAAQPQEVPAEQREPTRRQIVFNWLMGEDMKQKGGYWGTTDQVEHIDELLAELDSRMQPASAAKPPIDADIERRCAYSPIHDAMLSPEVAGDLGYEIASTQPAKPAEDGLEAQLRACIRYTAARLRDEHEDLEEDIYAAVLNFIQARERELRDKLEGLAALSERFMYTAYATTRTREGDEFAEIEQTLRAILASHWPAAKE